MAALTFQATVQASNKHIVVRSTDDGIGAATAALIFDNTLTRDELTQAMWALTRAAGREFNKSNDPAQIPTTGQSVE